MSSIKKIDLSWELVLDIHNLNRFISISNQGFISIFQLFLQDTITLQISNNDQINLQISSSSKFC